MLRLAGIDVIPGNVVLIGLLQDGPAGELRPIVTDDASRLAIDPHQCVQLVGQADVRVCREPIAHERPGVGRTRLQRAVAASRRP